MAIILNIKMGMIIDMIAIPFGGFFLRVKVVVAIFVGDWPINRRDKGFADFTIKSSATRTLMVLY